jgi:predicted permease
MHSMLDSITGVMFQILSVFLLIGFGWIFSKSFKIPDAGTVTLTNILVKVSYPCFVFTAVLERYDSDLLRKNWALPLIAIAMPLIGYMIGRIFLLFAKPGREKRRAFLYNCAINNYLFLPLPIISARYGMEGVILLTFMTIGSEIAVWTIGVYSITGGRLDRSAFRKILNVPLISLVTALIVAHFTSGADFWEDRAVTLVMGNVRAMSATTIPLAMLVAGINIGRLKAKHIFADHWVGWISLMRLLVIPAILLIGLRFVGLDPLGRKVASVVAVMPTAIASTVFVEHYGGDREFIGASIIVTTVLMLLTAPLLLSVGVNP